MCICACRAEYNLCIWAVRKRLVSDDWAHKLIADVYLLQKRAVAKRTVLNNDAAGEGTNLDCLQICTTIKSPGVYRHCFTLFTAVQQILKPLAAGEAALEEMRHVIQSKSAIFFVSITYRRSFVSRCNKTVFRSRSISIFSSLGFFENNPMVTSSHYSDKEPIGIKNMGELIVVHRVFDLVADGTP